MTELRESRFSQMGLGLFLVLVAFLAYHSGGPAKPSMPGVNNPESLPVVTPAVPSGDGND